MCDLSWPSFREHTQDLLSELYTTSRFADVTLVCDDQTQFRAHKYVLSACSSVLKNVLKLEESHSPYIYLSGLAKEEVEYMLQVMYLGESYLPKDRVKELHIVAEHLGIEVLLQQPKMKIEEDKKIKYKNNSLNTSSDETFVENLDQIIEQRTKKSKTKIYKLTEDPAITSNSSKRFYCDICQMTFTRNTGLLRHKKSVHEGRKYPCKYCDYKANSSGNLNIHVGAKHEGVRYPCQQCDATFTQLGSLKQHFQSIHEGIRYPCNECDYRATQPSELRKHVIRMHPH